MLYAGIWSLISITQTVFIFVSTNLHLGYAFIDSSVFYTLFSCFFIVLWYPIYFNQWDRKRWYYSLAIHCVLAGLMLLVVIGIGYTLLNLLVDDYYYLYYLKISVSWKILEGIFLYVLIVLIYYLYINAEHLHEKADNEIRLNKLIKDTELNLLKSQINPHFLFNSLNSVNALIIKAPEQAGEMLVALSDYLRYTVLSIQSEVSEMKKEMENIERYLAIEKLRFGNRLEYTFDVSPECMSSRIPSMLLQPLFENAIKHGVYESMQTIRVSAKARLDHEYLYIEVSNDFDAENTIQRKGSGTGLKNIKDRLYLTYGTSASLQIKAENGKFIAALRIPGLGSLYRIQSKFKTIQ